VGRIGKGQQKMKQWESRKRRGPFCKRLMGNLGGIREAGWGLDWGGRRKKKKWSGGERITSFPVAEKTHWKNPQNGGATCS